MKLALFAFACAPGRGSEPNIGWNVALQAARRCDVWVLTDRANEALIAPALADLPIPRPRLVFVEPPPPFRRMRGAGWLGYVYYAAWQAKACLVARNMHREVGFDLAHHVTYANSWLPTGAAYLGIPFVWSAGNRDATPWVFLPRMSWQSRLSEMTRNAVIAVGTVTANLIGRRASLILTASDTSKWPQGLPILQMPIGGLDDRDLSTLAKYSPRRQGPFRPVSIGRPLGCKGFHLSLQAFALLRNELRASEYWLVGDGPERQHLERLARTLGCADSVFFLGWQPHERTLALLAQCDVLVHPSLHEQFGYVILEAMAAGRPVICLNVSGPRAIVSDGAGFLIQADSPGEATERICAALLTLARNERLRAAMGSAARRLANENHSWHAVGERLLDIYEEVACSLSQVSAPRA